MNKIFILILVLSCANCVVYTQKNTFSGQPVDNEVPKQVLHNEFENRPGYLSGVQRAEIIKIYGKPAMVFEQGRIYVYRFYEEDKMLINLGRRNVIEENSFTNTGIPRYHLVLIFDSNDNVSKWNMVKLR